VQSAAVLGGALLAVPATSIVRRHGRRPGLAGAYLAAALGALLAVSAAKVHSVFLLFVGFFLFGGATTASLQMRYAAVDLAPPALHGRHLSLIVWATTIGGVTGPNLAGFAGSSLSGHGIPPLAAPLVLSAVLFAVVAALLFVWLRPDPLRVAPATAVVEGRMASRIAAQPRARLREALAMMLSERSAQLGITATTVGHIVMVAVMVMTPVHIAGDGRTPGQTLRLVGTVLSAHVAGMYAFAPVMGWLSDRFGRPRVIIMGAVLLLSACAVAGTAGHNARRLAFGLVLLGLGWSATMVAGSALVSESMSYEHRPAAQGLSDMVMGLAAALGGAVAGAVVQAWGYPTLTLLAGVVTVPLLALALDGRRG
jgi:MFS family permease